MEKIDTVVIGAGVVGIAIARELSLMGREVVLLDKEKTFGQETSSRNSEVIHAGIYYPQNSLKAKLCLQGRNLLYDYCEEKNIKYKKTGKLIVATSKNEIEKLSLIQEKAKNNGVLDIAFLNKAEVLKLEPELNAVAGLFSPSTGIIDSHEFMLRMLTDFENNAGIFLKNSKLIAGKILDDGIELTIDTAGDVYDVQANLIINSAGLYSGEVLENFINFPQKYIPKLYYAKGNYFSLMGKAPFKHLIYPVPEDGGLGVHLTLDIAGKAKFGPNVQWLENSTQDIDYKVDESLRDDFYQNIKKYWSNIKKENLMPDYAGIRVKIAPKGQESDFYIQTVKEHGINNLINLFGIESPGLTSSLAIAKEVARKI